MFTIDVTDQGVLPTILRKQDDITTPICIDNMIPTRRTRKAKQRTSQDRARLLKNMENNLKQLT